MFRKLAMMITAITFFCVPIKIEAYSMPNIRIDYIEYTSAEIPSRNIDGRTLVAPRDLVERMNGTVEWDPVNRTVFIQSYEGNVVVLRIGQTAALVNGETVYMDVPAQIIGNKTYVPLRFIGEAVGYTVNFDQGNNLIDLFSQPDSEYTHSDSYGFDYDYYFNEVYTPAMDAPEYILTEYHQTIAEEFGANGYVSDETLDYFYNMCVDLDADITEIEGMYVPEDLKEIHYNVTMMLTKISEANWTLYNTVANPENASNQWYYDKYESSMNEAVQYSDRVYELLGE